MANASTIRIPGIRNKTTWAFIIGFAIAAVALIIGASMPSVPWLALGGWIAASLAVLLIDRAVGEKTPRPGREGEENFGAIFQGSPAALIVIAVLAVGAFLIAMFVR
jgi:hypothetical protein